MRINHNNCEAFFLDYYEGNLSKEGVEELFAFLTLNPEMREVFDSYEEVSFAPEKHIHFDGKADLKKSVELNEGINENNYEEYFVSEVEGLLSAEEKIQLINFIALHPEKAEELEMLKQAILIPDTQIVFEGKDALKKSVLVSAENFEEMAIASLEGLLNSEEEKVLTASIAVNAEQQKTVALYQQTKLTADTSIVFEDKESLKHRVGGAFYWMRDVRFAAAAVFALLLGIFFWNYSGTGIDNTIAKVDTTKVKSKSPAVSTPKSNDQIANVNDQQPEQKSPLIPQQKKQIANNPVIVPVKIVEDRAPFIALASRNKNGISTSAPDLEVNFSDTYFNSISFPDSRPVASSKSITPQQAAMRWMKKKLDRTPAVAEPDEEETQLAYAPNNNGDVSGFELTSSAVDALAHATGANLHLGKETEGTVLTVGKYSLMLNRNN